MKLPLSEETYYEKLYLLRELAFFLYPLNTFRQSIIRGFLKFSDKIGSPKNILEIGCGTGFFTRILAAKFPNSSILSIDLSKSAIEYASKKEFPNVKFKLMNLFELQEQFSLVIAIHVLNLFPPEQGFDMLKKIMKTPGLAFITYTAPSVFTRLHQTFYKLIVGGEVYLVEPQKIKILAKQMGFRSFIMELNYLEKSFALILEKT